MMPNIYDKAYELAGLIEKNENFLKLIELSEKIKTNTEQLDLIKDYQKNQLELYQKKEAGEELTEGEYEKLNDEYQELMLIEDIKQLFQAEHQLSLLINDVYRIINGPLIALNPQEKSEEEE